MEVGSQRHDLSYSNQTVTRESGSRLASARGSVDSDAMDRVVFLTNGPLDDILAGKKRWELRMSTRRLAY